MNTTILFEEKYRKKRQFLTESQLKRLRRMNLGYGNFIQNARRAGMHINTYRYILDRGYGYGENIEKIRMNLLSHESRTHQ